MGLFHCGRMVSRLAFSCHRLAKSKTKYRDNSCRHLISTRYDTIMDRSKVFFLFLQTLVIFLVFSASTYFKRCRKIRQSSIYLKSIELYPDINYIQDDAWI